MRIINSEEGKLVQINRITYAVLPEKLWYIVNGKVGIVSRFEAPSWGHFYLTLDEAVMEARRERYTSARWILNIHDFPIRFQRQDGGWVQFTTAEYGFTERGDNCRTAFNAAIYNVIEGLWKIVEAIVPMRERLAVIAGFQEIDTGTWTGKFAGRPARIPVPDYENDISAIRTLASSLLVSTKQREELNRRIGGPCSLMAKPSDVCKALLEMLT